MRVGEKVAVQCLLPAQGKEKAESPIPPRSEVFTSLLLKTAEYVMSSAKNEIAVKEGQEGEW